MGIIEQKSEAGFGPWFWVRIHTTFSRSARWTPDMGPQLEVPLSISPYIPVRAL